MSVIEDTKLGVGGEIQITDAISAILGKERIDAYRFDGIRYDCGSKLGYLQANVAYAMQSEELGVEFSNWLSNEVL
jgi:UTP--glucose-1-phosphate uridylyltransferase